MDSVGNRVWRKRRRELKKRRPQRYRTSCDVTTRRRSTEIVCQANVVGLSGRGDDH